MIAGPDAHFAFSSRESAEKGRTLDDLYEKREAVEVTSGTISGRFHGFCVRAGTATEGEIRGDGGLYVGKGEARKAEIFGFFGGGLFRRCGLIRLLGRLGCFCQSGGRGKSGD